MPHSVDLIATVAVSFVLAFVFGYIASRLRLPPLVGYLVAGVVAGPVLSGNIADVGLAGQLAEIGVILLMFGVGLHFSAADLLAVRSIAIPGAFGQIVLATFLGIGLGHLWGWSLGAGLVFGLSLSVASTVVLLKALEERNILETPEGRVAVGWLIVEDLAMVLALVLLPTFAVMLGGHAPGTDPHGAATVAGGETSLGLVILFTLGKVAAFVAIAMMIGPKIVPWILGEVARTGSRELFTLSVLAVALGIAYGSAVVFGVSFALGAFFAGVVLSESHFSHRAAGDSLPLQDAFSVLFFVSVGMLFDPSILLREPLKVLAVLSLIMVGKGLIAVALVTLLRFPMHLGLSIAASLAQVGEFSFILIGLGMSLGLLPAEGRDLILAGSLLSITLNPFAFVAAKSITARFTARASPAMLSRGAARFAVLEQDLENNRERGEAREKARELKLHSLIETFPMLALVDGDDQEELLLLFRPKTARPGERIFRKGDRADGMYFISSGAVQVLVGDRTIDLDAGGFFGEMALLSGSRRTADVVAVDYCQFLVLERRDFAQFMARHPAVLAAVNEMATDRVRMNEALDQPMTGNAT